MAKSIVLTFSNDKDAEAFLKGTQTDYIYINDKVYHLKGKVTVSTVIESHVIEVGKAKS